MSARLYKFNFRKLVSKKKKDSKYSQESIQYNRSNDYATCRTGRNQHQPNRSDGDISLRRRGRIAGDTTLEPRHYDASRKRYEPNLDNFCGSKEGAKVSGFGLKNVYSSVVDLKQLQKRRSKTQEPKSNSVINDSLTQVDSMSRNLKDATWDAANASPFGYQKSISTPCITLKKTVKQTTGFNGIAIGLPNLRTFDLSGTKARFTASGAAPVDVPDNNTKTNSVSTSWGNIPQDAPNKILQQSSDGRSTITNRARKLFALKVITGEIWNPEQRNIPDFVEQGLSDISQTFNLKPINVQRPEIQKDFFQDKARKSLVDTVKKVVSSQQPANQNLTLRAETNSGTNKMFVKHIRAPNVEPSKSYSDTSNLYFNSEQRAQIVRPREQLENFSREPVNPAPSLGNVPDPNNLYQRTYMRELEQKAPIYRPVLQKLNNELKINKIPNKPAPSNGNVPDPNNLYERNYIRESEQKAPLYRSVLQQLNNELNDRKIPNKPVQSLVNVHHTKNIQVTKMRNSEQIPFYRPLVQQLDNGLNVSKIPNNPAPNLVNVPHTNNLHVANIKTSDQKEPVSRIPVQKFDNSFNVNRLHDNSASSARNVTHTNNLYLTKIKNSEQRVPRYRPVVQKLDNGVNASKVPDNPASSDGNVFESAKSNTGPSTKKISNFSEPNSLIATKFQQKSNDSKPPFFEKVPHNGAWHIRKVSDFVWQKLKKMTELASSNFKLSPVTKVEEVQTQEKKDDIAKPNVKMAYNEELNLNYDQELKNVTQFARPIPKKIPQFIDAVSKSASEFARPFPKTIASVNIKTMLKGSYPNFEKEQGFVWSNVTKFSKLSDQNLKTFGVSESAIRKFPFFEVLDSKKEHDFEIPDTKQDSDFVLPNVEKQLAPSPRLQKVNSEFTKPFPINTPVPSGGAPNTARVKKGFDLAGPELPERIPVTSPRQTEVTNNETLPYQAEQNNSALNKKEDSEVNEQTLVRTPETAEPKGEQLRVLVKPIVEKEQNLAEPKFQKQSEFISKISKATPKLENLSGPAETNVMQEPGVAEPRLETEPEPIRQNPENMTEHKKFRKMSVVAGSQSQTTSALDGTKLENVPDADRRNVKKLPVDFPPTKQTVPNLNFSNDSSLSPKSKFEVLNQVVSAVNGKATVSTVNTLHDTATGITVNVTRGTSNNLSNDLGGIAKSTHPPELETSWKINVVHNAHGKGKQLKASGSFTGIDAPTKPVNYGSESQSVKTLKKMSSMSHNTSDTYSGRTESLLTTRILKTANLQNYPVPKMFNQVERGDNKFLVFWKGREVTNIFSNPNTKQSLLISPQSARRTSPSSNVNPQKASENDSISRQTNSSGMVESTSCMSTEDSSTSQQPLENGSSFLPVVCVPTETLPCVVSNPVTQKIE